MKKRSSDCLGGVLLVGGQIRLQTTVKFSEIKQNQEVDIMSKMYFLRDAKSGKFNGRASWLVGLSAMRLSFGTIALIIASFLLLGGNAAAQEEPQFTTEYRLQDCNFQTRGTNPYFILQPEYHAVLEGEQDGTTSRVEISVLRTIKRIFLPGIGMITTRVVRERHYEDDELVELSKNYFSVCEKTNDIYYFGEAVNIYHPDGTITHEGAWLAGAPDADGLAQPGIIMPGTFLLGARYYQEIADGIALDRAVHTEMNVQITVPAGTFNKCVRVVETTPLEPGAQSLKVYCPGIGLVKDGINELTEYGFDDDLR